MNRTAHRIIAIMDCTYLNNGLKGADGYALHPERPTRWEFASADMDSRDEAQALLDTMPKVLKAFVVSCSHGGGVVTWSVRTQAVLAANGNNKGINETGIRRYQSLLRWAAKTGVAVEFDDTYQAINAYRSKAAFEAAIQLTPAEAPAEAPAEEPTIQEIGAAITQALYAPETLAKIQARMDAKAAQEGRILCPLCKHLGLGHDGDHVVPKVV